MKQSIAFLAAILILTLQACLPNPLDIQVPQAPPKIAVSSTVIDNNSLFVLASYSVSSLMNLDDTTGGQNPTGVGGMLIKNAMVVLSSDAGTDTLVKMYDGMYGTTRLNLSPFKQYQLFVKDLDNGRSVTATTTYIPLPKITEVKPAISRTSEDTLVKLHIAVKDNVASTGFYLMSYSTTSQYNSRAGSTDFPVSTINTTKKLELFSNADALNGTITRDFILEVGNDADTLYVHIGQIERRYYEYLTAYKRTGSLFNQLTGEPINLPTNVTTGLGYFSLYHAQRKVFFLKDY
jgi:hypothetical protein